MQRKFAELEAGGAPRVQDADGQQTMLLEDE